MKTRAQQAQPESLYIDNGGIVLLWPFLDRYFSLLELQKDGVFLGESQQQRAVHLLHYLGHGAIEAPAHALALNKILCGMDAAAPVESGGALTEREQQVSEQVLRVVVQQWRQLDQTSIDGLRSVFLLRTGHLVQDELQWRLQVERGTFDVLLPTLPWMISTIRLPWMARALEVSW